MGPFYEFWFFCFFHRFLVGFWWCDWLGLSSSLILFLWNYLRVSLTVFGVIILLKGPPSFRLHYPWQQIFHLSLLRLYEVCQCHMLKNIPTPWSFNMLSLQHWSLAWWVCIQAMVVSIFFETTVLADSRSFCSSQQVILGSQNSSNNNRLYWMKKIIIVTQLRVFKSSSVESIAYLHWWNT